MVSTDYDIGYLEAGYESLESYLISDVLFWPIHTHSPQGEHDYYRLTLGNLLLSQKRLDSRNLTNNQLTQLKSIRLAIEKTQYKWRSAWIKKANDEFLSRIRQWDHYLQDLRKNPEDHEIFYPNEVRARVIIDLLISEIGDRENSILDALNEMDAFLQKIFIPGPFLWEQELSNGFDIESFWYLWGLPKFEETLLT